MVNEVVMQDEGKMKSNINALSANIGICFSMIGTKLYAAYEKRGADGYAVLLIPSEQTADNGVSLGQVIEDIRKMVKGIDPEADTASMEKDLEDGISGLKDEKEGFDLDKLMVKLQMAFLYICKTAEESTLEYAFRLQIITEDIIPEPIRQLVTADNVSVSVWNTDRKMVLEKMGLVTIDDYLGIGHTGAGFV